MTMTFDKGKYVNIVGTVDLKTGDGTILYVNPTTTTVVSEDKGHDSVELVVEDAEGNELARVNPVVRQSSCTGPDDTTGLIQEDIPYQDGMQRVRLLYEGVERSRFDAGPPPATAGTMGLGMEQPEAAGAHRRTLSTSEDVQPESGVSYIVEARPEGGAAWQTIAVGRETPKVKIDRNQFPGARHIDVRVLRSTGFDATVTAQERLSMEE